MHCKETRADGDSGWVKKWGRASEGLEAARCGTKSKTTPLGEQQLAGTARRTCVSVQIDLYDQLLM